MHDIDIKEDYLLHEGKTWQEYVSMGAIEIICGETPFLASRYDTVTGEAITNLSERIGWLDRKLCNYFTAMTKYSDFIKQGNDVCYNGIKVMVDEVLDYSFEEIPTKAELDETPNLFYASIVYENQSTETVSITELVPLRHVTELTEKELIKLKKQIHPGSFFLGDYENSLGIERKELSDVCDCYIEALECERQYEWLTKDTPENFAEYCMEYYCISETIV